MVKYAGESVEEAAQQPNLTPEDYFYSLPRVGCKLFGCHQFCQFGNFPDLNDNRNL